MRASYHDQDHLWREPDEVRGNRFTIHLGADNYPHLDIHQLDNGDVEIMYSSMDITTSLAVLPASSNVIKLRAISWGD